jgi:hypothetical protein
MSPQQPKHKNLFSIELTYTSLAHMKVRHLHSVPFSLAPEGPTGLRQVKCQQEMFRELRSVLMA